MKHQVIAFHYTLSDPQGKTLDSSVGQEPLTFMEGANQIIPGLEKRMQTMKAGEKKKIVVPAAEGYGEREDKYCIKVPLDKLPGKNVKVGDQFQAGEDPSGHPFIVLAVTATDATLDANHPLAGVDLSFDVEIVSVRNATAEEEAHGHAHGQAHGPEGGHTH